MGVLMTEGTGTPLTGATGTTGAGVVAGTTTAGLETTETGELGAELTAGTAVVSGTTGAAGLEAVPTETGAAGEDTTGAAGEEGTLGIH